ncbi:MAG: hypothetical protein RBS57_08390 [Desulforhabdus sp.]|jgi:hypothetical protein|nr:hypothetical protein [Desulforhabdus sp.]
MWQYSNQALNWWCELQGQNFDEVTWQIYLGQLSLTEIIAEYLGMATIGGLQSAHC